MNEADIARIIEDDVWMMSILRTAASLHLPDWWIGAGFVRNKVWDTLSGFTQRTLVGDIDVIYFDSEHINELDEKIFEQQLRSSIPHEPWSVKNQARMGLRAVDGPYASSSDALSRWPETATCIAVSIDDQGKVLLTTPLGITDLISMTVRPSPSFTHRLERVIERQ